MRDLIYQFGGKTDCCILLIIVTILFLLNSSINNRKIRILSAVFSSIFIVAQLLSLYFTQTFIGYQFYVHTNLRGVVGVQGLFVPQMIMAGISFIILIFVNIKSNNINIIFNFLNLKRGNWLFINASKGIVTIFLVSIAVVKGDFIADTETLLPLLISNETKDFKAVLNKYNMSDYVTPNEIESTAGKNIIIISMESLERGFLNGKHAPLTPNLNKLKDKWNYFDLKQNKGSEWTSGSLYTYLTGFPALFGVQGNEIFQTAYNSNISSISHALSKANYKTTYLNGNTDHSGVKEMLNVFQFDKIIDYKNTTKTGYESMYGLRDKDLFSIAKSEIKIQNNSKKPFALFISTTDTHAPNGIYDKRMESIIPSKDTKLEFTVASLDYLIGDFIAFLEKEGVLSNTTIYLFPDHLKMGNPSIFKDTGERSLYCITNSQNKEYGTNLYQIDLPKIILEGANITHNIEFLTDYISGNKNEYIIENILPLTEINTNGILNSTVEEFNMENISKHYADYKKDTLRFIAHAGGKIDNKVYTNSLEALDFNYSRGFRLFELDIIRTKDNYFVAAHDWQHWANITEWKGELPVTKNQFLSKKIFNKYTPLDMDSVNKWFDEHKDAILVTDKVNSPYEFSELFIDRNRLMMELFDKNAVNEGLKAKILSAMPSQSVVGNLSISEIKKIAADGVRNVAISRRFIYKNKSLLKELRKNNIKIFAYHINYDEGIDEDYVTKYEMDAIFGIYADEWTFE